MTIHAAIEYLKYKWRAMGRHGIHSPFVYELIELVIQDRGNMQMVSNVAHAGFEDKYSLLLNRIIQHHHYDKIVQLPTEQDSNVPVCDVLILPLNEPLLWLAMAGKYFSALKNDAMAVCNDVHKTAMHSHEWKRMCDRKDVKMSIDLNGIGLLFFKSEFKEKQHFVLKYDG